MGAPRLTDTDIKKAVRLLDGWTGKLTWARYLAVLATEIGHLYTKPAMHKHARIVGAWEAAHRRLAGAKEEVGAESLGDAAIAEANRKIARLRAEVSRLDQENRDLLERFVRWSHNAARAGLSPEQLDNELPTMPGARGGSRSTPGRRA